MERLSRPDVSSPFRNIFIGYTFRQMVPNALDFVYFERRHWAFGSYSLELQIILDNPNESFT